MTAHPWPPEPTPDDESPALAAGLSASGPAYVRTVDLQHLSSQRGLGLTYVPDCHACFPGWYGPTTRDEAEAREAARLHNETEHAGDQGALW